jgi:nitrogen PTS system EIIA component
VKLLDFVREDLIFPDLAFRYKTACLRFLTQHVAGVCPELDEEKLYAALMERERLSSTGIGGGIAIPHIRLKECRNHLAALGRSRAGIPFEAIDEKPVNLVFLLVGPEKGNEVHLKALARIAKFLHDVNFKDRLLTARDASSMYRALAEKDAQY